jgi:hypothetical protein
MEIEITKEWLIKKLGRKHLTIEVVTETEKAIRTNLPALSPQYKNL